MGGFALPRFWGAMGLRQVWLLRVVLLALAYFAFGKLVFSVSDRSLNHQIVTLVIFIPEGIALAAVLIWGRSLWPGIFLGQFLLALPLPVPAALGIALVNSLEAYLGATLFQYFRLDHRLTRLRDLFGLMGLIVFVLQPLSALLGNGVLWLSSVIATEAYWKSSAIWWFGNLVAQILITPTLLLLHSQFQRIQWPIAVLVLALFGLLNYLLFCIFRVENMSILLSIMIPLVTLTSIYQGLACAMLATILVVFTALYSTDHGVGAFSGEDLKENFINLNFYILSQTLLNLFIGILFQEKQRSEQRLRETNQRLQEALQLREQVERIGRHDLKNPLNAILNIPLLIQDREPWLTPETKELLNHCQQSAHKMLEMINRSLDLYKIEMGTYPLKPVQFDLVPLLHQVARDCALSYEEKRHQSPAAVDFQGVQSALILGEELLCHSLFSNLLMNALEASPPGKRISIQIEQDPNAGICSVRITNWGEVPSAIRARFFEKLVTHGKQRGTGLGTYSARLCAEVQGGSVALDTSQPGKTSVWVHLPLA